MSTSAAAAPEPVQSAAPEVLESTADSPSVSVKPRKVKLDYKSYCVVKFFLFINSFVI